MKWARRSGRLVPRRVSVPTRGALSVLFLLVGGGVVTSAGGADTTTTTTTTALTTSTTVLPTTTTTVRVRKRPHENPFTSRDLATFLASRKDDVTAALFNVTTGVTYLYRPGIRQIAASMVKIDILANLLYEDQMKDVSISKKDAVLATTMIEFSNNKAAQKLWVQTGQLPASEKFNELIGLSQTESSWGWGDTETTPRDQLQLLKAITLPNAILTTASRTYEESLMQNVSGWQRFGIPTAVPSTAIVGVKNGWYPETLTGWQINTAGYVHVGKCFYLAVVMTAKNPNEDYGLDTVNTISHVLWNFESNRAKVSAV